MYHIQRDTYGCSHSKQRETGLFSKCTKVFPLYKSSLCSHFIHVLQSTCRVHKYILWFLASPQGYPPASRDEGYICEQNRHNVLPLCSWHFAGGGNNAQQVNNRERAHWVPELQAVKKRVGTGESHHFIKEGREVLTESGH